MNAKGRNFVALSILLAMLSPAGALHSRFFAAAPHAVRLSAERTGTEAELRTVVSTKNEDLTDLSALDQERLFSDPMPNDVIISALSGERSFSSVVASKVSMGLGTLS